MLSTHAADVRDAAQSAPKCTAPCHADVQAPTSTQLAPADKLMPCHCARAPCWSRDVCALLAAGCDVDRSHWLSAMAGYPQTKWESTVKL
jgi:hypothetical protein